MATPEELLVNGVQAVERVWTENLEPKQSKDAQRKDGKCRQHREGRPSLNVQRFENSAALRVSQL